MFRIAALTLIFSVAILDLSSKLVLCKYSLDELVRIARERSIGSACTSERYLYDGAMKPSCSDYDAQLKFDWQVSYCANCLLDSYVFLKSWWFFATAVAFAAFIFKLYFTPPPLPPQPIMLVYPKSSRRLSIAPRMQQEEEEEEVNV
jgi:hypothetical protein